MNETIVALAPSESEPHCCYVFTDSGSLWELRTDVRSQSIIYALDKEELAGGADISVILSPGDEYAASCRRTADRESS